MKKQNGASDDSPAPKKISLLLAKTLVELVNTSASVNELLLAGKERMALGADIYSHITLGGLGLNNLAARANNLSVLIFGMDTVLHSIHNLSVNSANYN